MSETFSTYTNSHQDKENNHKEFNLEDSLKYPPGFTPINDNVNSEGQSNKFTGERLNNIQEEVLKDKFNEDAAESTCSGHFKKSNISRTGGSILQVMEEMVKVGHTMGYNMEGCIKNIEEIIKSQGVNDETKMENIDLFSIKRCWGNLAFDYAHSASVGNSGGILCVWDPKSFSKLNATISDYFVMGLDEVPLGGCSYTWCHKSASKMSKLDRFLIFESLMNSCPNISAITLERFLSDHLPILMRESHYDYGHVPFRKRTLKSDLADLDLIIDKGCGDVEIDVRGKVPPLVPCNCCHAIHQRHVEIIAVHSACSLAFNRGWLNAIVESLSQVAIAFSSLESPPPWSLATLVDDIRLWSSFMQLSFLWVNRERNQAADWSAPFPFSTHLEISLGLQLPRRTYLAFEE
ncbi:RNA-directed DNA polymerase, eukaryota [Tanacetum coccineum]